MTSLSLLLWILLGIAVQLAVFLILSFVRYWTQYQQLSLLAAGEELPRVLPVAKEQGTENTSGWSGFRPFRVTRKVVETADGLVYSFYLVPEDNKPLPFFLPGQFLTFRLDEIQGTTINPTAGLIRCYSLSDAPCADHYRVSIKRVPSPPGSKDIPPGLASNHFHDGVREGSILQVRAPSGHFHIDAGMAPVVLIAGGIGITPLLSMIEWSLAEQPGRELWLFYGVRNSREQAMKSRLEALAAHHENLHLHVCYSAPLPGDEPGRDYLHRGRVNVALLRLQLALKPYHFYICGPTPMMENVVGGLDEWGVPDARIHFEAFGPASIRRRKPAVVSEDETRAAPEASTTLGTAPATLIMVNFARSGRQHPWNPASANLLEFAEANGISVACGCRTGACGTCQTTIRTGEVVYLQTPAFDPEPGSCLPCVCQPKPGIAGITLEA